MGLMLTPKENGGCGKCCIFAHFTHILAFLREKLILRVFFVHFPHPPPHGGPKRNYSFVYFFQQRVYFSAFFAHFRGFRAHFPLQYEGVENPHLKF
jgi:hypothetical protein